MKNISFSEVSDRNSSSEQSGITCWSESQAIKNTKASFSKNKLCRLCAQESQNLIHVFGPEGRSKNLPEKISQCLPILISEEDDLPTVLCTYCSDKLESVRLFFESIIFANQGLILSLRLNKNYSEDVETHIHRYLRHFTPLTTIKVEPLSFGTEKEKEDEKEEEEEDFKQLKEKAKRKKCTSRREDKTCMTKEISFLDGSSINNESETPSLKRYDPYFDDLDINYATLSSKAFSQSNQIKNGKSGLIFRGRKKIVPLSLKTCSDCGEEFKDHGTNLKHWKEKHPDKSVNYQCTFHNCNFQSTETDDVYKHRLKHKIENARGSVPQQILTLKDKSENARLNSGFKPFSCDYCGKSFSQKGNMEEHRRTHTGERPFVCELCGSSFVRRSELQLHTRCAHTGERPYQCSFCPKNFQRRDLLRKHERIHTDTRPYSCEYCTKTFTQRDKMVVHTRLHTGERPYVCEICGKGFCESGNLKKHLRVHGKEAPKILHQNNKGKPPPPHPSSFIPTKNEILVSASVSVDSQFMHSNSSSTLSNSSSSGLMESQTSNPVDYTFPTVAAVMMQQQHSNHSVQHPSHRSHNVDSNSLSQRSLTPSYHHPTQSPNSSGPSALPHYAMHGLIQHLSDWNAVYGNQAQLSSNNTNGNIHNNTCGPHQNNH